MPLTPADVQNMAFYKPPLGKRGYHEGQVDAFLDQVEYELNRLYGIIAQLQAGPATAAPDDTELRRLQGVVYDLQQRLNASELRVAQLERSAGY
jgi:DivIVA domain-containing protein